MNLRTDNILHLFYQLPRNIATIFSGRNLIWHILAIAVTYILVISGFDWFYFSLFDHASFSIWIMPAIILGGLLPIFVPLGLWVIGKLQKNLQMLNVAFMLGQAVLCGSLISSTYKALTGRVPPVIFNSVLTTDISREFQFGFLRGGIFWGWPSSHTTIAFAMAVSLVVLYLKNKKLCCAVLLYALYVGLSISVSIHWFSEFVAGTIIGSLIGVVVGRSFLRREKIYAV